MADQRLIDELMAKLQEERDRILQQARSLTEEQASFAPDDAQGEAQWTPKEQWAHMAEMETNYRAWIRAGLEQDDPDVGSVRGEPVAIPLTEANQHSNQELIDQLVREREQTLQLLRSIPAEQYDRTATNALFGTLTLLQWARSYYRHDRMHLDQIAGREPEYKPKFAGGTEPDQRRRAPA
ncbi:MAG TPA: DinB family protein [Dehalococcoidia bacterium]|nr:DinB family protein [Dehalococcoidia bacterium]